MLREPRPAFFARGMPAFCFLFSCLVTAAAQPPPARIPEDIQALLDARRYSEAEQAIASQLQRTPDWDVGHVLLGQIANQAGRCAQAEQSGRAAIRLRESVDGFTVLAVAAMHLGKLNESIEWLEKAANRRPDYAEIYRVLGLDYALGGNLVESEKAFRRAAELEAQNWELHYLRGRALYELRLFQDSEKVLRRALELKPDSTRVWTALGQTQESLYDPSAAEESYRKALGLCGSAARECAWPLMQLGFLASRRKSMPVAEEFFRQAIAARPDWAKLHFYLGKTLASRGDFHGARAEMEIALRLDESKSEYHYQLAQVYKRLGESHKVAQHMARYQALGELERKKKASAEFVSP